MVKRVVCLVMAMILTYSIAYSDTSTKDIEGFFTDLNKLTSQISIETWGENEQSVFLQLSQKHGLIAEKDELNEYQWSSPISAFFAICEAAYGPNRYWTLEQSHRYSVAAFESGLENQVSYLLPPEDGLSEEEAVAMAREGIIEQYSAGLLPCDISMLDECTAKAMYVRHDPSPLWTISFYHDDYPRVPVFSAEIFNETYVQVSCDDVSSMYNIYAQWRAERNQILFRYWPLEDQQSFYDVLISNYQRELEKYGELPPFAKTILSHRHSLPREDEVQVHEAKQAADQVMYALGNVNIDAHNSLKRSVMFFRDEGEAPVYEVRYYEGDTVVYRMSVNAGTGEANLIQ